MASENRRKSKNTLPPFSWVYSVILFVLVFTIILHDYFLQPLDPFVTYDEDFLAEDSRFIMAKDIKDICPDILPNEIAIIEYPNLDDNSIPSGLLNIGTINLLVTRANRTWKDVDQKALKELQSQLTDQNTLFMYLTEAQRYAVEEFVGQLPPYTKFNNFVYRMSQMGLTAVENSHAK